MTVTPSGDRYPVDPELMRYGRIGPTAIVKVLQRFHNHDSRLSGSVTICNGNA